MKGSCLCGAVAFEVSVTPSLFYRCHCSLCRKRSGTGYNLATLVNVGDFSWLKGDKGVTSWTKQSGYRSDFCSVCGSTVPNTLRDMPYVWIPVGLLDERLDMQCIGDYCTDDAMPWDKTRTNNNHAGPVTSLAALLKSLKLTD